jgi:hypothetical protein
MKETIKQICAKSWSDTLTPDEVERLLAVKRYRVRSELGVSSLQDFMDLVLDTTEAYFSVVYLWNGRGFSALRPFCDCERVEWIHPLHLQ